MTRLPAVLISLAILLLGSESSAEDPDDWERREDDVLTIFQLGAGFMALPAAEVCPRSPDVCEPGETSVAFDLQALGRIQKFAFGAGIAWAFGLRPNAADGDTDGLLERQHSRSYFRYEGVFRYYLPLYQNWEWWVGSSLGGVVVNDSWSVLADREPYADTDFIGPRALTLATEGLAVGIGAGAHWRFAEYWLFGARFQYQNWFLPDDREMTPTGDYASLAGRVDIFDVGLALSLRLPWPN